METITKTTDKIHTLVLNHMALANKLACGKKRCLPPHIEFEELQSAAYLGLVEAANRFEPERGFCFTTYAYPRISGAINDYLRSIGQMSLSLDDGDVPLKDAVEARKEANTAEVVEFVTKGLGDQAREMFQSYFFDNYSMKEIARKHGVSESRVSQLFAGYRKSIQERWSEVNLRTELAA